MFMSFAYRVSKVNVLILGCWLFLPGALFEDYIGYLIVGFLFLYDEFWKGTALLVGYCILSGLGNGGSIIEPILVLGC